MRILLFPALALLTAAGVTQAAPAPCTAPVFPVQSTSAESVRRVEQQVSQWRQCQAARTAGQDPEATRQQDIEVDAALQKWASATRLHALGRLSERFSHAKLGSRERENDISHLSPMPPVYGAERK